MTVEKVSHAVSDHGDGIPEEVHGREQNPVLPENREPESSRVGVGGIFIIS